MGQPNQMAALKPNSIFFCWIFSHILCNWVGGRQDSVWKVYAMESHFKSRVPACEILPQHALRDTNIISTWLRFWLFLTLVKIKNKMGNKVHIIPSTEKYRNIILNLFSLFESADFNKVIPGDPAIQVCVQVLLVIERQLSPDWALVLLAYHMHPWWSLQMSHSNSIVHRWSTIVPIGRPDQSNDATNCGVNACRN